MEDSLDIIASRPLSGVISKQAYYAKDKLVLAHRTTLIKILRQSGTDKLWFSRSVPPSKSVEANRTRRRKWPSVVCKRTRGI